MSNNLLKFLEDKKSGEKVFNTIQAIIAERNSRPAPPINHKYKRDFIDNAIYEDYLNFDFVHSNLEPVILGTSKLTMSQRSLVKYVVNRACDEFYANANLKSKATKIFYKAKSIFQSNKTIN